MHGLSTIVRMNNARAAVAQATTTKPVKKQSAAEKLAEQVAAIKVGDRFQDKDSRVGTRILEVCFIVHEEGQKFSKAVMYPVRGGVVRKDTKITKVRLDRLVKSFEPTPHF
jgi:hypothetical protein